ncbi:MAG TPA: hypothetical protein VFC39_07275 [Acidobacteriaceae bacterium]|nr:hypothetical protein [Acidobacteriaceae bacterium]
MQVALNLLRRGIRCFTPVSIFLSKRRVAGTTTCRAGELDGPCGTSRLQRLSDSSPQEDAI